MLLSAKMNVANLHCVCCHSIAHQKYPSAVFSVCVWAIASNVPQRIHASHSHLLLFLCQHCSLCFLPPHSPPYTPLHIPHPFVSNFFPPSLPAIQGFFFFFWWLLLLFLLFLLRTIVGGGGIHCLCMIESNTVPRDDEHHSLQSNNMGCCFFIFSPNPLTSSLTLSLPYLCSFCSY